MNTPGGPAAEARVARRRERNRAALVAAAQDHLAAGTGTISIHELTERADIGFGSFYTYFESKDDLLRTALHEALQAHGRLLDLAVGQVSEPTAAVAALMRSACTLQRTHAQLTSILLNHGLGVLRHDEGLAPRARRLIGSAVEAGTFTRTDPEWAVMAAGGALFGTLHLLHASPALDSEILGRELACGLLVMFGASPQVARDIAALDLPVPPRAVGL